MKGSTFRKLRNELIELGFTDLEAAGAVTILSTIPDIKRLLAMPDAKDFIMSVICEGIVPVTDHQQALIDGMLSLTEKQRRYYYQYEFEGVTMVEISRQEGVSYTTVQDYIRVAKGKFAAAKNGELNWEDKTLLENILIEMSLRKQKYFELSCVKGLPADDVAKKLGVSPWTVKGVVRRMKSEIHYKLVSSN